MKNIVKVFGTFLIAGLLSIVLCGCGDIDAEELYSLPKQTGAYAYLQTLLDEETANGYELSAPEEGTNCQSIQFTDLDGDGSNEALAFLRKGDETCIKLYKLNGEQCACYATVQGEGRSFARVDYANLTGGSRKDIIVLWEIESGMRKLSVYDSTDTNSLMDAECSDYLVTDINGDSRQDLLAVKEDEVSAYLFFSSGEISTSSAKTSTGVISTANMQSCYLSDHTPALLLESYCEDDLLCTDLFVYRENSLFNITLNSDTGISTLHRSYDVLSQDIDEDGCLEVPVPTSLFSQSGEAYWSISWRECTPYGETIEKQETYHCYTDGWYLTLPGEWHNTLTVRRDDTKDGERCVIFSSINRSTGEVRDSLAIYTLSGENREELSQTGGRFVLAEDNGLIYAAEILNEDSITTELLVSSFHLIQNGWDRA